MYRLSSFHRSVAVVSGVFCLSFLVAQVSLGDGDLDPSFGDNGEIIFKGDPDKDDLLTDIFLQADGKIIGVGWVDLDLKVIRLNPDGTFDTSFGRNGTAVLDLGGREQLWAVTGISGGKYLAVGNQGPVAESNRSLMLRLRSDGSLDSSFAQGGVLTLPGRSANDLLLLPDGRIVVGVTLEGTADERLSDLGIVCVQPNGSLDSSFGRAGTLRVDFGGQDILGELALALDGRIIAAGRSHLGHMLVCRVTPSGSLDSTFGSDGKVVFENVGSAYLSSSSSPAPVNLAVQLDGKILVGMPGWRESAEDYYIARLNLNGTLDPSFGHKGVSRWAITGPDIYDSDFGDFAVQADGKIVAVGGISRNPVQGVFLVARFHSDGDPDFSFGNDGWVQGDYGRTFDAAASSVVIQPDGKILTAGVGPDITPTDLLDMALARYLSSIDRGRAVAVLKSSLETISPPRSDLLNLLESAGRHIERAQWRPARSSLSALALRVSMLSEKEVLAPEHGRRVGEAIATLRLSLPSVVARQARAAGREGTPSRDMVWPVMLACSK